MSVGVEKGKLEFSEYDPQWAVMGQEIVDKLKKVMVKAVDIKHVGSTAIPGMLSKPIIDVAVAVNNLDDVLEYVDELKEMGIFYAGEVVPGQREFGIDSPDGTKRICHIHCVLIDSNPWKVYSDIVDYCTAEERPREAYILLKRALLLLYEDRPERYGIAKHEFMEDLKDDAAVWRASQKK